MLGYLAFLFPLREFYLVEEPGGGSHFKLSIPFAGIRSSGCSHPPGTICHLSIPFAGIQGEYKNITRITNKRLLSIPFAGILHVASGTRWSQYSTFYSLCGNSGMSRTVRGGRMLAFLFPLREFYRDPSPARVILRRGVAFYSLCGNSSFTAFLNNSIALVILSIPFAGIHEQMTCLGKTATKTFYSLCGNSTVNST